MNQQEAQLSLTDRAMLRVNEYFTKSLEMTPLSTALSPCWYFTVTVGISYCF